MAGYIYRLAHPSEIPAMHSLVKKVFLQFEAPDYSTDGISEFLNYIQMDPWVLRMQGGGISIICMSDDLMIGVLEMRKEDHLSLLFVDANYHHQGIASSLWQKALDLVKNNPSEIEKITVNSSPYAVQFYKKLGFVQTMDRQERNGIIFFPMVYELSQKV